MNVARLYLLCGLPFSGKSTLARQLAQRLSGTVVSFDAINYERGLGFAGEREVSPAEWDETYGLARSRVAALLRSGRDVILDDVMGFAQARRDFRELASASGGETVVVYIDVSVQELWRRRRANIVLRERPDVQPEILERVAALFEPPTAAEGVLVFRATDRFEAWVEALERPRCEGCHV